MQSDRLAVDSGVLEGTLRREVLRISALKGDSATRKQLRGDGRADVLSKALGSAYEQLLELKSANREIVTLKERLEESECERSKYRRDLRATQFELQGKIALIKSLSSQISTLQAQWVQEREELRKQIQESRSELGEFRSASLLKSRAQDATLKIVEKELSRREVVQQARDTEFEGQLRNCRIEKAKLMGQLDAERVTRKDLEKQIAKLEREVAEQRESIILPLREQKALLEAEIERCVLRGRFNIVFPVLVIVTDVCLSYHTVWIAHHAEAEKRMERERVAILERYPSAFEELWSRWSLLKREYILQYVRYVSTCMHQYKGF